MARLNKVKSFRGTSKTEDGCLTCGKCRTKIEPGMPYQWWANRLPGSRSGSKSVRCMNCTPTAAEMTPGRRGELMRIQDDAERQISEWEGDNYDDLEAIANSIAEEIRGLGEELRESAQNIEDGFGHATYQSEELEQRADDIDSQADEIEQCSFDDPPEAEDQDTMMNCPVCDGAGEVGYESEECEECGGDGEVLDAEANAQLHEEAMEEWREAQRDTLRDRINDVDLG